MATRAMPVVKNPIRTYGDLKEAVSLWMDRDDDEFVKQIPNFIDFGQKEVYRNLRIPPLEKEIYLSVKDGVGYIPPDFLEAKFIMRARNAQVFRLTSEEEISSLREADIGKDNDKVVKYARFGKRWLFYPLIEAGTPHYPDDGSPEIPANDAVILCYYSDPAEFVNDDDTDAILTIAPDLLLYFALRHACLFVQDNEGAQKWSAMGQASMEELEAQAKKSEWKGSPLVIPPRGFNNITSAQNHHTMRRTNKQ